MSLETDVKNIAKDIAELKAAVLAHLSPAAMLTVPNAAPAAAPALPVPAATVPTMPPSVSVPVPTAAPSAPPAVPQSFAPPAPPAPLAPPPVAAKSPARAAFEEKLGQLLVTVQEAVAEQVLLSKLGAFQVQRVGDLQEGHFDVFLQHIQHGLTNPSA